MFHNFIMGFATILHLHLLACSFTRVIKCSLYLSCLNINLKSYYNLKSTTIFLALNTSSPTSSEEHVHISLISHKPCVRQLFVFLLPVL